MENQQYPGLSPKQVRDAVYTANNVIQPNIDTYKAFLSDNDARVRLNEFAKNNPTQDTVNQIMRPALLNLATMGLANIPINTTDAFIDGMARTDNPEDGYTQAALAALATKGGKLLGKQLAPKGVDLGGRNVAKNTGRFRKEWLQDLGAILGDGLVNTF